MSKGVVLFAHNTAEVDYYKMAVYTAKRVNKFLNLPVTIITDADSITDYQYKFDCVRFLAPDSSNTRKNTTWNNKGRYQVYELSPYQDTLILDVDYLINSSKLLDAFSYPHDFICHNTPKMIMRPHAQQEKLSENTVSSLWATVIRFTRTSRSKQIFDMIKMVQENYGHYSNVYKFDSLPYRNDYALTIALKTVNHHISNPADYFNWNLLHVSNDIKVYRDTDTSYTLLIKANENQKSQYIKVKDLDFHMLGKRNFLELIE